MKLAELINAAHTDVTKRHELLMITGHTNGNPNGDPDMNNLPRTDPETMIGLISQFSVKRKVRDFVDTHYSDQPGNTILIGHGSVINPQIAGAYEALGIEISKDKKPVETEIEAARKWMCENYYDARTFGAVLSTGLNSGQIRGAVQINNGNSVDPVDPQDIGIARVAVTDITDKNKNEDGENVGHVGTMGRHTLIPYGLYTHPGFVIPSNARKNGFTNADLALFWESLLRMWDLDRTSGSGLSSCVALYVFSHSSELGQAPAHKLFNRVKIERKDPTRPARKDSDYSITLDTDGLHPGITVSNLADLY